MSVKFGSYQQDRGNCKKIVKQERKGEIMKGLYLFSDRVYAL